MDGERLPFPPLPYVKDELAGLQKLGISTDKDIWLDEGFSRQQLLDVLAPTYNVLHVASHYRFATGREDLSVLLLGNGLLTLGELAVFDYSQFELIAFSACGSGLSENRTNFVAIEGLGGAVLKAGARSALVTLWNISDKATPKLTEAFYRAATSGNATRAVALQKAQLQILRNNATSAEDRHPKAWGAFVLMGQWR